MLNDRFPGIGGTNGVTHYAWENGYSTDTITAGLMVSHTGSDTPGTGQGINDVGLKVALAKATTTTLMSGRLLYAINANNGGSGPLKLVPRWMHPMDTSAGSQGDPIFLSDTGAPSLTAGTLPKVIGRVDVDATAGFAYIAPNEVSNFWFNESKILANSSAVTNTVTNTAFDKTIAIPARHFFKGCELEIEGCVRFSATHSTDTVTITVLGGSLVVVNSGAVDVADDDTFTFKARLTCRGVYSATAEVVGHAIYGFSTTGSTALTKGVADGSAVDNTAALTVSVKCQWSVADTGNSAFLESLRVRRVNPGA